MGSLVNEMVISNLPKFKINTDEEIIKCYNTVKKSFLDGITRPIEFRKKQLQALYNGIKKWYSHLIEAQVADLKVPKESKDDIDYILHEISDYLKHLDEWIKPEYPEKPKDYINDIVKIELEPYGTWLNIAPWNFPAVLSIVPLIGAIAAGNTCVLKPSEMAPHTAAMITKLIEDSLDNQCYQVINGDKEVTTKLLEFKWDFIIYTGNGMVGRIVMQAASKHLTPLTLELGGKNPVFIDEKTADLKTAAKRIVAGKFRNAGQICVSPDHVFIHPKIKDQFTQLVIQEIQEKFNKTEEHTNWPRIINSRHVERIAAMIPKKDSPKEFGIIAYGGKYNLDKRYVEPTIITDLDPKVAPAMKEEIFGPILPIITMESLDDTIKFVKANDSPLGLYIFSHDINYINKIQNQIRSGGLVINNVTVQAGCHALPFGGVGESGMGAYHGRHSLLGFSHKRSVLHIQDDIDLKDKKKLKQ